MPAESLGKAIVILAIRLLGVDNRLLRFKVLKNYQSFQLKSGKMLSALYDTPEIFKGRRGGLAYISIWAKIATASQQP